MYSLGPSRPTVSPATWLEIFVSSPSQGFSVLVASDSLKESLTATDACEAMARAVRHLLPNAIVNQVPLADGGEGTLDVFLATMPGLEVHFSAGVGAHPQQSETTIRWALSRDRKLAVVELAEAAGLESVPLELRDPRQTGTAAVGRTLEMARSRLDRDSDNPAELVLTLGGSATVDGGLGAARALGILIEGPEGPPDRPLVGSDLAAVEQVRIPKALLDDWRGIRLRIACDVRNPLEGDDGAARVFGPQKGAGPSTVAELEAGLVGWRKTMEKATGWKIGGSRTGAAGGVVVGLAGLLGDVGEWSSSGHSAGLISERLEGGFDLVANLTGLDSRVDEADVILTSEGRLDASSLMGKAIGGLLDRADKAEVPVIAVPGSVSSEQWPGRTRFAEIATLVDAVGREEAMKRPALALEKAAKDALVNWLAVNQPG